MSRMWRYFFLTFTMFLIAPELRRFQDEIFGFSAVQILSIVPFLMLIPFFYVMMMNERHKRLPQVVVWMAWLWISGFMFSLFISTINGNLFGGLFTFIEFVSPVGAGLWLASEPLPTEELYKRLTDYLFLATTFLSIYAIIQWVVAPPWDTNWMRSIHATAFGYPAPFKIRAFSTLNAPAPFGEFVALIACIGLNRVSLRDLRFTAAFASWIIALGITEVRTGWLMFALGAIVYFMLTRRFQRLFTILVASMVVSFAAVMLAPDSPLVTTLSDRGSSLENINGDYSYAKRTEMYQDMIPQIAKSPLGLGLGVVGTTIGQFTENTVYVDSGFIARAIEMGWPGFIMFLATLGLALRYAIQRFWTSRNDTVAFVHDIFATNIAVQLMLFFLLASNDSYVSIFGIIFWTFFGCMTAQPSMQALLRQARVVFRRSSPA